ncbi:hypothetical protein BGZ68_003542, partial [Mortierella alpina]
MEPDLVSPDEDSPGAGSSNDCDFVVSIISVVPDDQDDDDCNPDPDIPVPSDPSTRECTRHPDPDPAV